MRHWELDIGSAIVEVSKNYYNDGPCQIARSVAVERRGSSLGPDVTLRDCTRDRSKSNKK